jgi:hypothetical protein
MARSWVTVQAKILFLGCYFLSFTAFSQIDTFSADSTRTNQSHADTTVAYPPDQIHFYGMLQVGVPLGELRDVIQNTYGNVGIGFAGGVLFNPMGKKPSPLLIGLDVGYLIYGVDKIPANTIHGNIKSSFNIYSVGLGGRLMSPTSHGFTPFLDGVLGAKIFDVTTKIDKDLIGSLTSTGSGIIDSYDKTTLSYSVGVGFFNRKPGNATTRLSFSMRVLYSWGMPVQYVPRNTVYIDASNTIHYQTANTQTNMLLVQFGFQLY